MEVLPRRSGCIAVAAYGVNVFPGMSRLGVRRGASTPRSVSTDQRAGQAFRAYLYTVTGVAVGSETSS